ncbi:MAG: hypothetical protein CMK00_01320 [Planctomycetes bacterium]|nr:hypothetical protein [Planctomycetota bacterium]
MGVPSFTISSAAGSSAAGSSVAGLLGFSLALGATAAGLRSLVPPPAEYGLAAKLAYLEERGAEVDTLFLGSSRVAYGIDAPAFDRHMAELGKPTHSFNLGVGGMTTLEANQVLTRLLDLRLPALRTVIIEFEAWDARIYDQKNSLSNRSIGWHTPTDTRQALQALGNTPLPTRRDEPRRWRRNESITHLRALALNLFSVGAGPRTLSSLSRADSPWRSDPWLSAADLEERAGFQDLSASDDEFRRRGHEAFLARPGKFTRRVERIPAGNQATVPLANHFNLPALAAQIARLRAAGLRPVYFTPPGKLAQPLGRCLATAGLLPAYLSFNEPLRYPELYAIENRNDADHLNGHGAALLAGHLAREFSALPPPAHTDSTAGPRD